MFDPEAANIPFQGFAALPRCPDGSVCLLTTGQAEINAASTLSSLLHSRVFDLTSTYFLVAGIAGVNPKIATIGAVTFAKYAVQPCAFDRVFPLGATAPGQLAGSWDGTEVFEVNDAFRQKAFALAKTAALNDTVEAQQARALYSNSSSFPAGAAHPRVVLCDTATSDTFWNGDLLGQMVENTTRVLTNGFAEYCTTQQEDNATLNALLRGALSYRVDFARDAAAHLLNPTPGFAPSLRNLRFAGVKVVQGIVSDGTPRLRRASRRRTTSGTYSDRWAGSPTFAPGTTEGTGLAIQNPDRAGGYDLTITQ
ncbi:purine nucleoside permease-domain-containing protein [Mycena rosella]|uniref:Purine nucleoside permease-domain-containing protein n=1 Tax=Mycena rosella TaxID=1033263 RepID=A0AAD7GY73_MYCRO|nr:purine nucleoside permease-domain-containing protein [Mycena rosella]